MNFSRNFNEYRFFKPGLQFNFHFFKHKIFFLFQLHLTPSSFTFWWNFHQLYFYYFLGISLKSCRTQMSFSIHTTLILPPSSSHSCIFHYSNPMEALESFCFVADKSNSWGFQSNISLYLRYVQVLKLSTPSSTKVEPFVLFTSRRLNVWCRWVQLFAPNEPASLK